MTPKPSSLTPGNGSHPISQLPPELLIEVFSILEKTDHSTGNRLTDCRTCALVCRSWADLCRRYIFRNLWVCAPRSHPQRFLGIAQTRASIPGEVRCLRYEVQFRSRGINRGGQVAHAPSGFYPDADGGTDGGVGDEDAVFHELSFVLDLLSNQSVESFTFDMSESSPHGVDGRHPWARMPEFVKKVLMKFIWSNPIVELELHHISGLPAAYLSAEGWLHPILTSLHLEWVSVCERAADAVDGVLLGELETEAQAEGGYHHQGMSDGVAVTADDLNDEAKIPKLRDFSTVECDLSGLVASMRPYVAQGKVERHPLLRCFRELKNLTVSQEPLAMLQAVEPGAIMEFLQFALRSTPCLESLFLEGDRDPFNYVGLLSDNLSLSSLQTLSHIELLHHINEPTNDPYFRFVEELSRLKARCLEIQRASRSQSHSEPIPFELGLKRLDIELRNDTNELPYTELVPWSRLDEVLAGSAESERVFSRLEHVRVDVEVGFMSEPEPRDFRRHLKRIEREAFPCLRSSQKIEFVFPVPKEVEDMDEEGSEGDPSEEGEEWDSDEHLLD